MPTTPNLNLNKIDRSSPTTTTFNSKTYIDDNMDLIDTAVGAKAPLDSPVFTGTPSAPTFTATAADGTAPMTVTSKTVVTNLNANLLNGYSQHTSGAANTIALRDANGYLGAQQFISYVTGTTPPLVVSNSTKVAGLNVDLIDSYHANATPTANQIPVRDANKNLAVDALITSLGHKPNLLLNPSFRQGSAGWSGIGVNGFSISRGANGEGVYIQNGTNTGASGVQVQSIKIPMADGIDVVASADMFTGTATAGEIQLQIFAFDAAGASLSGVAVTMPFGQGWTKQRTPAWKTPANTASIYVACVMNANTTLAAGGVVAWKNLKLENGTYPTAFSDDMIGATQAFPGSMWSDYNAPVLKAANGYQKLPNGLIIQWGQVSAPAASTTGLVSFPIAFPTACQSLTGNSNSTSGSVSIVSLSTTQFNLNNSGSAAATIFWIAIGY